MLALTAARYLILVQTHQSASVRMRGVSRRGGRPGDREAVLVLVLECSAAIASQQPREVIIMIIVTDLEATAQG